MAEFDNMVVISQEDSFIGSGSVDGQLIVGMLPVEIKVGADRLPGRALLTVQAHPDNSGLVYIGLDDDLSATDCAFVLTPGQGVSIKLDKKANLPVYALGSAADQKINIIEGRN